ncbi:hypothetical protein FHS43_005618 [Streptosporangium becharense]|uniref:Uncharacterized protein n=1 Tax=Streptosporangium becharense TaxID=1816182 RepID=A0A7W9MJV1_9ACTN|nr:hypothetical protein [Streptosporangium becharense]MBB2914306.1 hypothetical protein [Streptosporangium becharense]MBB5823662.1 hypothetical protein [Streptosporangium becharense]
MTQQLTEITISAADAGTEYETEAEPGYRLYWFGKDVKKTREEARAFAAAQGQGHRLADIPSEIWRDSAATYLDGPTWIASWRGDDYDDANVVLHPNGAITTVEDGNQQLPFLISYIG